MPRKHAGESGRRAGSLVLGVACGVCFEGALFGVGLRLLKNIFIFPSWYERESTLVFEQMEVGAKEDPKESNLRVSADFDNPCSPWTVPASGCLAHSSFGARGSKFSRLKLPLAGA